MQLSFLSRMRFLYWPAALVCVFVLSAFVCAPYGRAQTSNPPGADACTPPSDKYHAVTPTGISILSPSDATIKAGESAVCRIYINPPNSVQQYYVCLDYEHDETAKHMQYKDSAGALHPLPCAVLFEPAVTYVDVTLVTDADILEDIYPIKVYNHDAPTTYQSVPLIVHSLHAEQAGNGQPIPISCTAPNSVQADVEIFDCMAGVNRLLTATPPPHIEANTEGNKRKAPPTVVLVKCSLPELYSPGSGLVASRAPGSHGWPATLTFKDYSRQTKFTIKPRPGKANGSDGTLTLSFYAITNKPGDPQKLKLCLVKNIPIIKPQ